MAGVTISCQRCASSSFKRLIFVNSCGVNRRFFSSLVGKKVPVTKINTPIFGRLGFRSGPGWFQKLKAYEMDTRVPKDVLLFEHDNRSFFRVVNFFAVSQVIFWGYLAHFSYTTLRDVPQKKEIDQALTDGDNPPPSKWWQNVNLGNNKYRIGITILCCSIGYIILTGSTIFTMRSVRSLTLLQGGQAVKLVCYSPWWSSRVLTAPLENLSCNVSRDHTKAYMPIKIKGYWMYFLLDKAGSFPNAQLFDHTAGCYRIWVEKKK